MDKELKALEEKLSELVGVCQNLRAGNRQLRQQLAQSISDNKQLTEKISGAKTRLEVLLTQIPENER